MIRLLAALVVLISGAAAASASACRQDMFEGVPFSLCEVTAADDLRLFLDGPRGNLGSFRAVDQALAAEGKTLGFAMNAGMYHRDRSPVGLYIEGGEEKHAIVTAEVFVRLVAILADMGIHTLGEARAAAEQTVYAKLQY